MPPAMRSNSYWYAPRARPTSMRPLLITSSRAHSPATRMGCQNGAMMVPAPRRMVVVFAAR
ncbi:hypothetical protein D3C84_1098670 [compost metagenome]